MKRTGHQAKISTLRYSWTTRSKTILLLLVSGFMFLTSCTEEAIDVNNVNQQTVFVYMPWSGSTTSNGLYTNFLANLDSIEAGIMKKGTLGKTRVVVFISESADKSHLYEVVYDNNACTHKDLKTYHGNTYTTAEGIASILNDVRQHAYALNYAMLIGCHGTGWTHVEDWQNYPNNAKPDGIRTTYGTQLNVKQNDGEGYETTRFFGSVSSADYATNIETLAEGIRQSGMHMQYILFDDCYMANAEVAYELREVTNFMIASTSEVMAIGMPYADMWSALNSQTPDYSKAVSAFLQFYSSYRVPCGTLAAIDCRQMDNLADVMRQINEHYTLEESAIESIQMLDGFNIPIFFDLGDYVSKLCTDPYLYEKFSEQLKKTVVSKGTTANIYSFLYTMPEFITVESFSGMTISDPSQNPVVERGRARSAWWKATH